MESRGDRTGSRRKPIRGGRFWSNIAMTNGADACWEWLGSVTPRKLRPSKTGRSFNGGYGMAYQDGKSIAAHRAMYIKMKGPVPPGMDVCHTCDNRRCVNPAHLFLGTRYENILDCKLKGRHRGHNGAGKLTRENVEEILRETMAGVPGTTLAARFAISHYMVYAIIRGRKHRDVPRPEGFCRPSRDAWLREQAGGNGASPVRLAAIRRTQAIEHTCDCGRVIKGNAIGAHRKACRRAAA